MPFISSMCSLSTQYTNKHVCVCVCVCVCLMNRVVQCPLGIFVQGTGHVCVCLHIMLFSQHLCGSVVDTGHCEHSTLCTCEGQA